MERKVNILTKLREEVLTCPICCEIFEDPRLLPCQHIICWDCLQSFVLQSEGNRKSFPCPFCKVRVQIPKKGLQEINKCRIIEQIKTTLPRDYDITCDTCKSNDGREVYLCMECSSYACSKCMVWHSERTHKRDLKMAYIERRLLENDNAASENTKLTNSFIRNFQTEVQKQTFKEQAANREKLDNVGAKLSETFLKCSNIEDFQQVMLKHLESKFTDLSENARRSTNERDQKMKHIDSRLLQNDKVASENTKQTNSLIKKVQTQVQKQISEQEEGYEDSLNVVTAKLSETLLKCSNIENFQQPMLKYFASKFTELNQSIETARKEAKLEAKSLSRDTRYETNHIKNEIENLKKRNNYIIDLIDSERCSSDRTLGDINRKTREIKEEMFSKEALIVFAIICIVFLLLSLCSIGGLVLKVQQQLNNLTKHDEL